jgi:hypothetical protein
MSLRMKGEGKPLPNPQGTPTYDQAVISVSFRKPPFNFQSSDDPSGYNSFAVTPQEASLLLWARQEISGAAEHLPIPGTNLKWSSDNSAVSQPVARRVNVMTMTITYDRFPVLPANVLQSYVDTLNYNTWMNCAPGTVMFGPPQTVREASPDGTISQKLALTFKFRQYDWNKMLKGPGGISGTWDYVIDPTNSNARLFPYADFLQLLQWIPATLHNLPGS